MKGHIRFSSLDVSVLSFSTVDSRSGKETAYSDYQTFGQTYMI